LILRLFLLLLAVREVFWTKYFTSHDDLNIKVDISLVNSMRFFGHKALSIQIGQIVHFISYFSVRIHTKRGGIEMENNVLERIKKMLEIAHTDDAAFPPTDLYNEGWMLRILLSIQSEGIECFPFSFHPGAKWFSEAQIYSPFLPRSHKDPLGEKHTHLDGAIGHFYFQSGTKTGLALATDSTQFVVVEAKMSSSLSEGVTHAKYYDQAARTVACIAWTIAQSGRSVSDLESLGFYVVAPQEQITRGTFSSQIKKSSIREKVERRISDYSDEGKKYDELQTWYKDFFIPTLDHIDIGCVSWETIIDKIESTSIRDFYDRCLRFNTQTRS
jgi:hypothetical protein